ncbi:MAG TPA: Gfo/Idh/MocA family oxidoreductase [Planctomycetota bacterium]|nr:Gfo/Idh/MocA family oxidoreductase [Planctomycetota bacterium]
MPPPDELSRRRFLERSAALSAAGLLGARLGAPAAAQDAAAPAASGSPKDKLGLAFVGLGGRGLYLLRAHGYWSQAELERTGRTEPAQPLLPDVSVRALCDVYQGALDAGRACVEPYGERPAAHRDWRRVIDDPSVDAVYVATADVWHAPIALAALEAGKDVYVEKCMTNTIAEAKALREAVRRTGRVLQAGHQNRHSTYFEYARRLVADGVIGKVSVIQMTLGRNTPEGAYVNAVPADASPETISWELYQPPGLEQPFDPAKLFSWRRYFAFGTGIAGDLLSHDVDAANMILGLGIPERVTASGGIYAWKDGRETPDVYSVLHEYPAQGLSLTYNATLANNYDRKTTLCGTDGTLVLGLDLKVYGDPKSARYAQQFQDKTMQKDVPFIEFAGPIRNPELVTSPTTAWAEGKGLTFTTVGDKVVDTTRLAVEEFRTNVRERRRPLCGVDEGFDVAVACHLGTQAYLERRTVRWDREKEQAV